MQSSMHDIRLSGINLSTVKSKTTASAHLHFIRTHLFQEEVLDLRVSGR